MRHAVAGLVLESNRALPLPRSDCEPTVTAEFRDEEPPVDLARWTSLYTVPYPKYPSEPFWTVARRGDVLLLRVHGFADFVLRARGRWISCHPWPTTPSEVVEQLLIDIVLPRISHLLGRPCLHAAAVLLDGIAIAFAAPSGSGKSTLCAALTNRGARMVCDDALAMSLDENELRVSAAYPSVRIWSDSATALFDSDAFPLATPRVRKLRVERPFAARDHELRHIFLLTPDGSAPRLTDVAGTAALRELMQSVHRLVPDDRGAIAAEFRVLSEVVARIPIHRLHFRHAYDELPQVADLIEKACLSPRR